jgi:hypothetical protein
LTVRISSTDSDTRLVLATVDLFKALGGGWQPFEPSATTSAALPDSRALLSMEDGP